MFMCVYIFLPVVLYTYTHTHTPVVLCKYNNIYIYTNTHIVIFTKNRIVRNLKKH